VFFSCVRLPFILFEAIDTEEIGGVTGREWERSDPCTTTATGPVSFDSWTFAPFLTRPCRWLLLCMAILAQESVSTSRLKR
jgi:hypothetical protein